MLATLFERLLHHRFFADVLLADVLDGYTRFRGQRRSLLAHKLA